MTSNALMLEAAGKAVALSVPSIFATCPSPDLFERQASFEIDPVDTSREDGFRDGFLHAPLQKEALANLVPLAISYLLPYLFKASPKALRLVGRMMSKPGVAAKGAGFLSSLGRGLRATSVGVARAQQGRLKPLALPGNPNMWNTMLGTTDRMMLGAARTTAQHPLLTGTALAGITGAFNSAPKVPRYMSEAPDEFDFDPRQVQRQGFLEGMQRRGFEGFDPYNFPNRRDSVEG